jgi:hypothetical protein
VSGTIPDELFLADIAATGLLRCRAAVFMTSGTDGMPNVAPASSNRSCTSRSCASVVTGTSRSYQ